MGRTPCVTGPDASESALTMYPSARGGRFRFHNHQENAWSRPDSAIVNLGSGSKRIHKRVTNSAGERLNQKQGCVGGTDSGSPLPSRNRKVFTTIAAIQLSNFTPGADITHTPNPSVLLPSI